jgi:oligopeptide transport system substrate-binding protein
VPDRRGAVAAVLATLTLTTACTTSAPAPLRSQSVCLADDQSLRVRLPQGPRTLDPALATDEREEAVIRQFSEPLLKPATDLRDVQPAAAESYDISADGLTWTFHLRANARYADNQQVRAQDFVYAWRRLIDPRTAAPRGAIFAQYVQGGEVVQSLGPMAAEAALQAGLDHLGLRAVDDLTFQVTTPQAAGGLRWIATLPEGGPMRPEMVKTPAQLGNGPFRVTDTSATRIVLVPNPNYWAGRATLSRLELAFTADNASALTAYQGGQYDELRSPPDTVAGAAKKDLRLTPELTNFWVDFNTLQAPFDNVKVRQAFAQAIDRTAIVNDLFHGWATPTTTLVPAGMRGFHPENGQPQDLNAAAARATLDQSGAARDQLIALPMIVRDQPLDRAIGAAVAAQLNRNLGVSLAVQPLNPAEYSRRLAAGDFALAGPEGWTADYPDEQDYFDLFRSNDGNNGARWRNSRYDALVKLADTETSLDKRDQLYNQAEQLLVQEAPVAFLVQRQDATLIKPYVRGLRPTAVDEWPGSTYSSLLYIAAH